MVACGVLALLAAGCSNGSASPATTTRTAVPVAPRSGTGISGWREIGRTVESTVDAGEGLATVTPATGPSVIVYRGFGTIPPSLAAEGWGHIGDPDSADGTVVDAYQGPASGHSKMFLVTTPSGATVQYVHTLVPGELYNNSFVAIAPGAQWMVGGEWGAMHHLQIFPTPYLNHRTSATGGPLPLAGFVQLDHAVDDVQGCSFVTTTELVCASDDDSRTRFANEKPLLEVDLSRPLDGTTVKGHVVDLGSIPQQSTCTGTFEAEGTDYDAATGTLRVEIIQPGSCILQTTVYAYTRSE